MLERKTMTTVEYYLFLSNYILLIMCIICNNNLYIYVYCNKYKIIYHKIYIEDKRK